MNFWWSPYSSLLHTHTHTHTRLQPDAHRCPWSSIPWNQTSLSPCGFHRSWKGGHSRSWEPLPSPQVIYATSLPATTHKYPTPENHVAGFQIFPSHFTCNDVPFWSIIPSWHPFLPLASQQAGKEVHTHTHPPKWAQREGMCDKGTHTV